MHTLKDFIDSTFTKESWIKTHAGIYRVSHIRRPETDPWAVTPDANGGFGCSWCVHYGTLLFSSKAEAEAAQ